MLHNVALAARIVQLTPHTRSLSLTGIFQLILAGQGSVLPQGLHSLTIGPSPGGWTQPIVLTHSALNCVKKLRICNYPLGEELQSIAGHNGALQQLTDFQWSIGHRYGSNRTLE